MGPIKRPNPFKSQVKLGLLQTSEQSLLTSQGITHPKTSASHEQNRLKVCVVCWTYTKIDPKIKLNDSLKVEIDRLFNVQFDYSDPRVPLGICSNYKNGLYASKSSNVNSRNLILQHRTFDHVLITPSTRSQQKCACIICETGSNPIKAGNFKKYKGATKKLLSIQGKKSKRSLCWVFREKGKGSPPHL